MDVIPVPSATSAVTIEKLRSLFATHGLPNKIVTDNGSVFTSVEFEDFMQRNGIIHVCSAPYHPASNGLAERAVQTFKQGIARLCEGSLETKLLRFLFKYRITPHATTGRSPAELLLGRQPQSCLDRLHPDIKNRVQENQARQKYGHDRHSRARVFQAGEQVYVQSTYLVTWKHSGPNWTSILPCTAAGWSYPETTCGPSEDPLSRGRHNARSRAA